MSYYITVRPKYIKRSDSGAILEVGAFFMEGEPVDVQIHPLSIPGQPRPEVITVTKFDVDRDLTPLEVSAFSAFDGQRTDDRGRTMVVYRVDKIGNPKATNDEVIAFLQGEMAKDTKRKPFTKQ